MLTAYLILAAWFWLIDMAAGSVAKSPPRPILSAAVSLFWPASVSFSILASAGLIRVYRAAAIAKENP